MRYVYSKASELEGTDKVGTKQCVELVKHYAKAPSTSMWKEGSSVAGNLAVTPGTAIATFNAGKYASNTTSNHAGFYLSQDAGGLWIMDQWKSDERKPKVSKRYLRRKGKRADGSYIDPSNNADAYAVIE